MTTQTENRSPVDMIGSLRDELGRVIVGQKDLLDEVLLALVAGGHVLLEGGPGLGKTVLVKTLADCTGLSFSRVQFTPDLMPADITGSIILEETETGREFRFRRGPIFHSLVLADEINRTPPKTQSPRGVNATATATSERSAPIRTQKFLMGPNWRPFRSLVAATCWPTRTGLYSTPHSENATANPASATAGFTLRDIALTSSGLVAVSSRLVAASGA